MTAAEYFRMCQRTWNESESFKLQVSNATIGIVGEVGEFTQSSESAEEMGDCFYYIATFMRLCGEDPGIIEPENLTSQMASVPVTLLNLTELAEHVKKWLYHGKYERKAEAVAAARNIASILKGICDYREWGLNEVWQQNIDKLKARYPEGFDAERAPE